MIASSIIASTTTATTSTIDFIYFATILTPAEAYTRSIPTLAQTSNTSPIPRAKTYTLSILHTSLSNQIPLKIPPPCCCHSCYHGCLEKRIHASMHPSIYASYTYADNAGCCPTRQENCSHNKCQSFIAESVNCVICVCVMAFMDDGDRCGCYALLRFVSSCLDSIKRRLIVGSALKGLEWFIGRGGGG